jgi:AhpD family alkylhydroperoxidase
MYDMKNLAALKTMDKAAETGMKSFWAFDKAAFAPGALDVKTKQMMALAVALTTQCPYCIEIHTAEARKAGAGDAELAETALVAAAMRAGAAITHATHMFRTGG